MDFNFKNVLLLIFGTIAFLLFMWLLIEIWLPLVFLVIVLPAWLAAVLK